MTALAYGLFGALRAILVITVVINLGTEFSTTVTNITGRFVGLNT